MTNLECLIAELCPNGVPTYTLGEIGWFYSGLSGKSKEDFTDGNAKYITYMNVFMNIAINTNIRNFVRLVTGERQNKVQIGDIIFTASSETPDECGMSSVLTQDIGETLYLNSFCFGLRLYKQNLLLPEFSKYLFRSDNLRRQIRRTASGVTRFNVSKEKMKKVVVSVPPIQIQQEIACILDKFTQLAAELTAELAAELAARKKQYDYYRNELLTFADDVPRVTLEEICELSAGGDVPKDKFSKEYTEQFTVPIYSNGIGENALYGFTNEARINKPCVTISARGTIGYVALRETPFVPVVWLICAIPKGFTNVRYLKYAADMLTFQVPTSGIPQLTVPMVSKYKIPLPKLEEQVRIVAILDRFDTLTTDITISLPAEIEARRKQYEYYRDKLLSF